MPLPVNAIIEATYKGRMHNQTIMTVFHYRVSTPSTIADPVAEVADFLASFANPAAGQQLTKFLDCVPDTYFYVEGRAQAIAPIRYRVVIQSATTADQGRRPPAPSANLASVLTAQSVKAGRREVGSKHLPTGSDMDVNGGLITAPLKTALIAFRSEWLIERIGPAGAGVYVPVIYHKGGVAPNYSDISSVVVQDTVRVMRRRTVGLGI